MDQSNDFHQWDDLLEQTFGDEGKPDAGFSASAPLTQKRPFYRKGRFWLVLTALLLVIGGAIWFFPKESQPEETMSPDDVRMEEALEKCKNALAQLQAQKSHYIRQSYLHYGKQTDVISSVEFWHSGEDFLLLTRSATLGIFTGWVWLDGKMYNGYAYSQQADGKPFSKPWYEVNTEDYEIESMIPWPIGFDWDASQIKGLSNVYVSDGPGDERLYTAAFAVVHDESVYGAQSPYHVNFTFGKDEKLESVTVVHTMPGKADQTSVTVVTFRLVDANPGIIAQQISEALQEPLAFPEVTIPST